MYRVAALWQVVLLSCPDFFAILMLFDPVHQKRRDGKPDSPLDDIFLAPGDKLTESLDEKTQNSTMFSRKSKKYKNNLRTHTEMTAQI